MKTTVDDRGKVRAALDAAADQEALVAEVMAVLKREHAGELRQCGAMGVRGVAVAYPIPGPQPDYVVFARMLDRHPEMVAEAMRTLNERNET